MSTNPPPSIGVILCSSRQPRVCPQVTAFVTSTIESSASSPPSTLHLIDLAAWNLPLFNEPGIPSQIKDPSDYTHEHTRAWSVEVQKYSAFIFVTPQYNWGYPAVLKNAIDYLYIEWHGKPAMVVSYGGHGGTKAAEQLKQVLQGVRMKVAETMPALEFGGRENLGRATRGEELQVGTWDGRKGEVVKAYEELMALVV